MSSFYPNVNKHVYPAGRLPLCLPVASIPAGSTCEGGRRRISAPPPYAEEDPAARRSSDACQHDALTPLLAKQPSVFLEVAVGHKLAKSLTQRAQRRRQAKLERVHDAWLRLGVDTRLAASQGGRLPPHFWSPPNHGAQEMEARLAQLAL